MDINDRKRESKRLKDAARAIMDEAQKAGRDMTAEEEQKFDRLMDDADKHDGHIGRAERLREEDREDADRPREGRDRNGPDGGDGTPEERAFRAYLKGGRASLTPEEARALNMGSDPEGGFLVAPQQFVQQLLQNVDDMVDIRRLASVQQVTDAESLGVPTLDTDLGDAEWTSEIGTGSQDDAMRFGKRELRPNPLAKRVKISRTLLRRATMNPEEIVRARLAYKFAVSEEKAYMTGDGNKKPLGLFTASADGISTDRDSDIPHTGGTLDSAAGAASDALVDAKYTLKPQYYRNARWLFHRDLIRQIRKLKDANNVYIWQAGLASDRPDTILDLPYTVNEFVPNSIADNAYVGMVGDFAHYWIADALSMEIQRLVELYAETNQVGFIGRLETDGMPVIEEAFVRLKAV